MKYIALCLACLSLIMPIATPQEVAADQKTVFNTESLKYETGTGVERCRYKCGRWSDPDVQSFLSQGWVIVGSSAKEVIAEQYKYVPCNTCVPHGCVCIGTEYYLRKDAAPPGIEGRSEVVAPPHRDTPTFDQPPNVETPMSEIDLLKREIDLLKQENGLLRKENESLRKRLRSEPR